MKFSIYERDSLSIAGITATPGIYDAIPPIPTVRFDYDLRKMHRDRFAVSSVLLFSEFCSGPLDFPERMSPEVADSIEAYFSDRKVRVMNVEYEPYAASVGSNILDVSDNIREESPVNLPGEIRTIYLDILPSDKWFGSISNIDHTITATNGHVVGSSDAWRNTEIMVGSAIALSDQLYGGAIRLGNLPESASKIYELTQLLASCNIELVVS